MGMTVGENAAKTRLAALIDQDRTWLHICTEIAYNMQHGFYNQELQSAIIQKYHNDFSIYDAFAFIHFWMLLGMGHVAGMTIEIGCDPSGDEAAKINNAKLANLPDVFSAKFIGGAGDCDGYLTINSTIHLVCENWSEGSDWLEPCPPARAPLEVGYTKAWTSLQHIKQEYYLARWPYDSNKVFLFYLTKQGQKASHEAWRNGNKYENIFAPKQASLI